MEMSRVALIVGTIFVSGAVFAGPAVKWWHQLPSSTGKVNAVGAYQAPAGGGALNVPLNPSMPSRVAGAAKQPLTVVVQATTGPWKDPVNTWADLQAISSKTDGDVRLVKVLGRAFTWSASAGAWKATAVDQNGVLKAGKVQIDDVVTEGNRCSDNAAAVPGAADVAMNGAIAKDANGLILSCQSGSWTGAESTQQFGGLAIPAGCPEDAWTNYAQRACKWPLQVFISFPKKFKYPPTVLITIQSLWTDLTPCENRHIGPSGFYEKGTAMDAQVAFPSAVTTTGFWLRAGSSLVDSACANDYTVVWAWVPNVVNWSATGIKG